MSKKEGEICECEMDFHFEFTYFSLVYKIFYVAALIKSNGDIISWKLGLKTGMDLRGEVLKRV